MWYYFGTKVSCAGIVSFTPEAMLFSTQNIHWENGGRVQAPGFRYYHKLAKMDEMFSEETLRHHVDMPWMAKPYFYSLDIRGLHRAKLSPFQKKYYAKLYRLRIVEQKRFVVGGAKYTEDLKRFHQLQDEYLLLVNNDIKSVVELVDFIGEQEEKIQQIEDRQKEIYRESSSRKRNIKSEEQYREYQMWHVEVQEELDKLKQEKKDIKRQIQLADDIVKEDLYIAYYAVSEDEEIVADREIEIPGMEELEIVSEVEKKTATDIDDVDMEICRKEDFSVIDEQSNIEKEQADLYVEKSREMDDGDAEQIYTGRNVAVDDEVSVIPMAADKVEWIADRLSECGAYEDVDVPVKADIFVLDIADVSGSIRLFSDVMKRLGIRMAGDEIYEEFQKIYDESVGRDVGKEKAEDKVWNRGRGR